MDFFGLGFRIGTSEPDPREDSRRNSDLEVKHSEFPGPEAKTRKLEPRNFDFFSFLFNELGVLKSALPANPPEHVIEYRNPKDLLNKNIVFFPNFGRKKSQKLGESWE